MGDKNPITEHGFNTYDKLYVFSGDSSTQYATPSMFPTEDLLQATSSSSAPDPVERPDGTTQDSSAEHPEALWFSW